MVLRALLGKVGLDEEARRRRLEFLGLDEKDERNLAEFREFAHQHVDEIVDAIYAHLWKFEETRAVLRDGALVARLKELQREYFLRIPEGRFDAEYFEARLRIGDAHQRINLRLDLYLGTYNLYVQLLLRLLREHYRGDTDRFADMLGTLSKVLFLDMGLAIDAYITGGYVDRALAQEYRRMAEVAERALREKMEAEAVKRDLTNMIVHDLKAPIGGILTVTQLALRKRGAIPEAHARRFEHIDRSARDLLRMIENLLEIDQLQEGRMELRVEPVDVARLLEECAEEFRPAAEAEGQHLRIQVADDVPVIAADRWLLRRVLNNLVTNAIRHSGSKGAIDLVAERAGDSVHLMVRDSGRGIPREEQALLFTKHRRRGRRTGSREDTGLGLVFCRLAVEAMGGSIGVTSAEGQGATFTVALPAAPNGS